MFFLILLLSLSVGRSSACWSIYYYYYIIFSLFFLLFYLSLSLCVFLSILLSSRSLLVSLGRHTCWWESRVKGCEARSSQLIPCLGEYLCSCSHSPCCLAHLPTLPQSIVRVPLVVPPGSLCCLEVGFYRSEKD